MSVRAKFRCTGNHTGVVTLLPVTDGSVENKAFWEATPGGQITLTITNPTAIDQFVAGQEYYVDFTPAN